MDSVEVEVEVFELGSATLTEDQLVAQFSEAATPSELPSPDALEPWGDAGAPQNELWVEDVLGAPYEVFTFEVADDEEGPVVASLVRRNSTEKRSFWKKPQQPKFALLYVHGRNDYFFQDEAATELTEMGAAFYALDLRKHGRSLRPWQTIGYTTDLHDYEEELNRAVDIVAAEHPGLPLVVFAHSMGGLISTLWANGHQDKLDALILNSAWLELQSLTGLRPALNAVIARLARVRPRATIVGMDKDNIYFRAMTEGWAGSGLPLPKSLVGNEDDPSVTGWKVYEAWKRPFSYPAPAAWMHAILEGHATVEKDVHLSVPVLSMTTTASGSDAEWSPDLFNTDVVLNADLVNERSAGLSNNVTLARFPGRHDLLLSDPATRTAVYRTNRAWLTYAGITEPQENPRKKG